MSGGECARFGRFNLVGVLGAALQVLLLDLLMKGCRMPAVAAMPIAVEIVVLHNFLWHERFTWRDRSLAGLRQRAFRLLRFHFSNGLISLVGNTVLMYCLVGLLKLPAHPSALVAITSCAPFNFLLADCWVYGAQSSAAGRPPLPGLPRSWRGFFTPSVPPRIAP
jgi:putative flippase GtrA